MHPPVRPVPLPCPVTAPQSVALALALPTTIPLPLPVAATVASGPTLRPLPLTVATAAAPATTRTGAVYPDTHKVLMGRRPLGTPGHALWDGTERGGHHSQVLQVVVRLEERGASVQLK